MDEEQIVVTVLPHSDLGDPDCCSCLNGIVRGDQALIVCNEYGAIVKTVPASDLQRTFDRWNSRSTPRLRYVRIAEPFT